MVGRGLRKFWANEIKEAIESQFGKSESTALMRKVDNRNEPALRRQQNTAWAHRPGLCIGALPSKAKISALCVKPIGEVAT